MFKRSLIKGVVEIECFDVEVVVVVVDVAGKRKKKSKRGRLYQP